MHNRKKINKALLWAGILAAFWIALIFLLVVPVLAHSCAQMYPELSHLKWPGLAIFWLVGLMCALGLWEFARVARRIARDQSFCVENAVSFRRIRLLAWAALGLLISGTVGLCCMAHVHPGILLGLLLTGLPAAVVAILSGTLSHLVDGAARLQQDSDLTI